MARSQLSALPRGRENPPQRSQPTPPTLRCTAQCPQPSGPAPTAVLSSHIRTVLAALPLPLLCTLLSNELPAPNLISQPLPRDPARQPDSYKPACVLSTWKLHSSHPARPTGRPPSSQMTPKGLPLGATHGGQGPAEPTGNVERSQDRKALGCQGSEEQGVGPGVHLQGGLTRTTASSLT